MGDLIDRQEAIDAARKCIVREVAPAYMLIDKSEIMTELMMLPTAGPKKGHWYHGEAYPHHLYCSVCYRTALPNDEYVERWNLHMNYCPNCGAKME